MSDAELREFLEAVKELRAANTASPEAARDVLKEEGFLTEAGEIAEPYAPKSDPSPSA